jgi:hypothetical protein
MVMISLADEDVDLVHKFKLQEMIFKLRIQHAGFCYRSAVRA